MRKRAPAIIALSRIQGYRGRTTGHGFRHTASTILNEQGFNRDHIERQLAHVEHVDATAYNATTHEVISSAADGTMTVIAQDDADHYHVAQTVKIPLRSKTFGLDEKTGRLFVPAAEFGPAPLPSEDNPVRKEIIVDGAPAKRR